jgi:hypothetical protein
LDVFLQCNLREVSAEESKFGNKKEIGGKV